MKAQGRIAGRARTIVDNGAPSNYVTVPVIPWNLLSSVIEHDSQSKKVLTMLLSELKESQRATVLRVGGDGVLRRRILEMGILKGTEVYVEKYAPLRDPMELIVKGYHISLRVEEAAKITVENVR